MSMHKNNKQPFSEHLLWAPHCVKHFTCVISSNEQLTWISGFSSSRDDDTAKNLSLSLVHPVLDLCEEPRRRLGQGWVPDVALV